MSLNKLQEELAISLTVLPSRVDDQSDYRLLAAVYGGLNSSQPPVEDAGDSLPEWFAEQAPAKRPARVPAKADTLPTFDDILEGWMSTGKVTAVKAERSPRQYPPPSPDELQTFKRLMDMQV